MDIYCRVTETGLVPLDDMDWELKKHLKVGTDVRVRISQPRNIKFHHKFFALLQLTLDNLPERLQAERNIYSIEALLASLKIDLGYFTTYKIGDGREVVKLRSISFAKMSQQDFERFYDLSITCILNLYLRGTNRKDLEQEVEAFINIH
jgi:hypothetical protein